MHDPWTWTTGWELTVEAEGGTGGGGKRGNYWDNCNRITIKNDLILKVEKNSIALRTK